VIDMRALVVYESMFGNTKKVADAVAEGLRAAGCDPVDLVRVDKAPTVVPEGVDLVVVGGPTHAFGMSKTGTREDAERQGAPQETVTSRGIREWVDEVKAAPSVRFATFDTRVHQVRHLPGSAARHANRHLLRRGFQMASAPTSYYVEGTSGPLRPDQPAAATRWGETMARNLAAIGVTR
jgi:hypothetical protein